VGNPKNFPWTLGFNINYKPRVHLREYILDTKPDAKIAILYRTTDYGKDYVKGLKDGLGDKAAKMVVAEASYEVTDPTIDSQIVTLKPRGADTFYKVTTPSSPRRRSSRVYDMAGRPLHILNKRVLFELAEVLTPRRLDKVGLRTDNCGLFQGSGRSSWKNDPGFKEYSAWFKKYYRKVYQRRFQRVRLPDRPGGLYTCSRLAATISAAENLMRQMTSIKDLNCR